LTLSQLRTFVTVARLGSVKEAAKALKVSEPAVSGAVRALRQEFGDKLYNRVGGVIELTPGGRQLARAAGDILGLAEDTHRTVHDTQPSIRVAATPPFAEFAAGPLLHAFKHEHRTIDVELQVARRNEIAELLADRRVDIALGPSVPSPEGGPDLDVEPFLRYGLVVVAAPRHTLAGSRGVAPASLVGTPWLLGPFESDPDTDTGAFLARQAIAGARTRTYPNFAAAMAQTAAGRGVTLAVAHTIRDELDRGALVELDVRGTPITGLWYVSTLPPKYRTPSVEALREFVSSPEAAKAMLARAGGVPAERFVHMGRWS
jgi:DNA-binding transcriptional LysR family regulator